MPSRHAPALPVPLAIIVMGVSGSGKSTLGKRIAATLDVPFLEGDRFHSADAVAKMRDGHPLSDEDRWPWLDRVGAAIDAEVKAHGLAVAACSALRRSYRDRLSRAIAAPTRFVLLDGSRDELWRRLAGRSDHYMPPSLLDSQLDTLERPAADEHALTLDGGGDTQALMTAVFDWLREDAPGG